MRDIDSMACDRLDEYFSLMASLLTVDEIRDVLLGKYIQLHNDIAKRMLVVSFLALSCCFCRKKNTRLRRIASRSCALNE